MVLGFNVLSTVHRHLRTNNTVFNYTLKTFLYQGETQVIKPQVNSWLTVLYGTQRKKKKKKEGEEGNEKEEEEEGG